MNVFNFKQEKIEAINQALVNEYEVRRKMLLKRLDVTVQSFGWSDRAKVRKPVIPVGYIIHDNIIIMTDDLIKMCPKYPLSLSVLETCRENDKDLPPFARCPWNKKQNLRCPPFCCKR